MHISLIYSEGSWCLKVNQDPVVQRLLVDTLNGDDAVINYKWKMKKKKGIKELGLKNLWPSAEYSPQIIILHWQHTFFR